MDNFRVPEDYDVPWMINMQKFLNLFYQQENKLKKIEIFVQIVQFVFELNNDLPDTPHILTMKKVVVSKFSLFYNQVKVDKTVGKQGLLLLKEVESKIEKLRL